MGSDQTNTVSSSNGLDQGLQKMRLLHGRTSGPTRRSTKGQWTAEEDDILCKAVQRFKGKNWKKIAECFKDRTDVQCLHRWQKVLNPELVKGPWSKEEDEVIVRLVEQYGAKKWSTIAQHLPGRIGKQCRERWHNHLNPAINKEAWSQDEELVLIQAHRVYGNKWAELTKFLPGRTDNAIKNHWNSSVKKKLDSYLASGLLAQFQGLPCVSHTNQSTPTSSRTQQCSGDDSTRKDVEAETSECSQVSTFVRCSQPSNAMVVSTGDEGQPDDMGKDIVICNGDESQPPENLNQENNNPCELGDSSKFIEQSSSHDWLTSSDKDELQNLSSLDLSGESEFMHCVDVIDVDENHEVIAYPINDGVGSDMAARTLASEGDCSKLMHPLDGSADSFLYQSSNGQIPHADTSNSQSYYTDLMGAACYHSVLPSQLPSGTFDGEPNQFDGHSVGHQEFPELAGDGLTYTNDSSTSHFYQESVGTQYQRDQVNNMQIHPWVDENRALQTEQQEPGSLSYEPPRFPSLDIPFFSCDLIESGDDMQHEYSPLGIRQLMMTSVNCFSPYRLWDSPSCDKSPEALLKGAAKTFTCTPSILKKRNRDLLSPLSEKRCEKKLERVSFSNLARDFSRLDVMFDENKNQQSPSLSEKGNCGPFVEDKENLNPDMCQKGGSDGTIVKVQQPPGILVQQNSSDLLFFSPDKLATKSDTPKGPHARTPGRISSVISDTVSDQVTVAASSCENVHQSLVSPRTVSGIKAGSRFAASIQSAPSSAPLQTAVENAANDASVETFGIFGETPFKKSLESPSAWKSPWFSFLPGPTVDTDITIEDIGYFTSPGERSYDALGLMKQLSEHTAPAYASAQEILGDETPDSILKKRFAEKGEKGLQESNVLTERRVLDFSECGSPEKGEQSARHSSGISFSSPSSYLLKGCR